MGEYLKLAVYPRNAFASDAEKSAEKAMETIEMTRDVQEGRAAGFASKAKEEQFNDARLFSQIVRGKVSAPEVSPIGELYENHFKTDKLRAWRWLSIRSGWLGYAPRESRSDISLKATELGHTVNVFDLIVRTLDLLSKRQNPELGFTFAEFLTVMDDDTNWNWSPSGIAPQIMQVRKSGSARTDVEGMKFLEVEAALDLSRDTLQTLFAKFAVQTGLFELYDDGHSNPHHGIRLNPATGYDPFLQESLAHVLKYPRPRPI